MQMDMVDLAINDPLKNIRFPKIIKAICTQTRTYYLQLISLQN